MIVSFLEQLEPDARERLMNAGHLQRLEPGDYLLRRGEKGGDVFLVESGTFDVVDTRTVPEVILQVVGAGAVLGEVAFLTGRFVRQTFVAQRLPKYGYGPKLASMKRSRKTWPWSEVSIARWPK